MEIAEILGYVATAVGGGGLTGITMWRINRRKAKAEVKADEIDNMRKAMEFYDALVKKQNERIAELEEEIKTIRAEKRQMQIDYQKQIDALQKQITNITRSLGIRAGEQLRDSKGRYTKKES